MEQDPSGLVLVVYVVVAGALILSAYIFWVDSRKKDPNQYGDIPNESHVGGDEYLDRPNHRCAKCSAEGVVGMDSEKGVAFLIRGKLRGKPVYKCVACRSGLIRRGLISHRLEYIPCQSIASCSL